MPDAVCPRFHRAIELVGGRWTGPILQVLMAGPARFATLRGRIPNISDRMLSERLHELEAERILVRSVIPESPVRVEYALTEKGRELQSSLEAVARWAERWMSLSEGRPARTASRGARTTRAAGRRRSQTASRQS